MCPPMMCPPMRGHWRHLGNTVELVLRWAHPSPQPKWQIDRFNHFCTAHGRMSLYFATVRPFFPLIITLSHAGSGPHLTWFLGLIQARNQNGISSGSAVFAQMTAECLYTLQWNAPFSVRIASSHGECGPPSNTWCLWPTQVLRPFLQGSLLWLTHRQTMLLCQ